MIVFLLDCGVWLKKPLALLFFASEQLRYALESFSKNVASLVDVLGRTCLFQDA